MEVDLLPPWARRCLASTLARKAVYEELPASWYEYPARSNFDKFDREKIREAAENDGLVIYQRGPRVTEDGIEWANDEEDLIFGTSGRRRDE